MKLVPNERYTSRLHIDVTNSSYPTYAGEGKGKTFPWPSKRTREGFFDVCEIYNEFIFVVSLILFH